MSNLASSVWSHSKRQPDRIALVAEDTLSYGRLAAQASAVAEWLGSDCRRVYVLGSRSAAACLGILGACWAGVTYIPLNPRWPKRRLDSIMQQCQGEALLVDDQGEGRLPDLAGHPRHVQPLRDLTASIAHEPRPPAESYSAYIIFTSGTTGPPKGVEVSGGAVEHLVERSLDSFSWTPEDRFGCNFELSFDGSVFDLFSAWGAGASLYLVPAVRAAAPAGFIRKHQLTSIVLTPSTIALSRSTRTLAADSLSSLRYSLFGAEALRIEDAALWQSAASGSQIYSFYGPTENTVTSMLCPYQVGLVGTPERQTVPLGRPLTGIEALVVDPQLRPVAHQPGELVLQGPQLASGYFGDPEQTARRFPLIGGRRSYLTGDLAYQDSAGFFHHLGRLDRQVKVLGHRVELEEVESALRQVTSLDGAAVLWQVAGRPAQIVAFTSVPEADGFSQELRALLPHYALPSRLVHLNQLPLTENGKIDYAQLSAWLDAGG